MSTLESEKNNNESSGKCSQVACSNKSCSIQKRKMLQIILSDLKLMQSKIREDDRETKNYVKEVCDRIYLLLAEEVLFKRFDHPSFKPEDGKWYINTEIQTARAEKEYFKELSFKPRGDSVISGFNGPTAAAGQKRIQAFDTYVRQQIGFRR